MARGKKTTTRTTGTTVKVGKTKMSVQRKSKVPTKRELKHKEKMYEAKVDLKKERARTRADALKTGARSSAVIGGSASAADTVATLARGGVNTTPKETPEEKPSSTNPRDSDYGVWRT